ncbi:hypothetical protein ACFL2U_03775 [Patescibacteria group bacterium]
MKIIFDEKEKGSHGDPNDPENTPEKIIERHRKKLTKLGKFMGADKVEYVDGHKREAYIITKGKKKITLVARGNGFDGGWLEIG